MNKRTYERGTTTTTRNANGDDGRCRLYMRTRIACFESENRSDSPRLTASHGKRAAPSEREYRLEVRRDKRGNPVQLVGVRKDGPDRPADRTKQSTPRAASNQRLSIPNVFPFPHSLLFSPSFLLISRFLSVFPSRSRGHRVATSVARSRTNSRPTASLTDVRGDRNSRLDAASNRRDGRVRASFQAWQIGWKFGPMLRARWPGKTAWMPCSRDRA